MTSDRDDRSAPRARTERNRARRRRGGSGSGRATPSQSPVARPGATARPRWRQTIDSFGGFLTVGAVGGAVIVVLLLVFTNPLQSSSDDPLLGEEREVAAGSHSDNPAVVVGLPGEPPVGGPHFSVPAAPGVYEEPVADGNAVHSLEHGIIWISYNPELVDEAALATLKDVASDFSRDTILSPRPQNAMPIAVASWGRLLTLEQADREAIADFVSRNRNRSPESGVR